MSQTLSARLESALDQVAAVFSLPALVVADDAGLLVASAAVSRQPDEVAALAALRASGDGSRSELASGRVKAHAVSVGEKVLVMGAVGDTAVCSAAFARVGVAVSEALAR